MIYTPVYIRIHYKVLVNHKVFTDLTSTTSYRSNTKRYRLDNLSDIGAALLVGIPRASI